MKHLITLLLAACLAINLQAKSTNDSLAFRNLRKTNEQRIDLLLNQLSL